MLWLGTLEAPLLEEGRMEEAGMEVDFLGMVWVRTGLKLRELLVECTFASLALELEHRF